MSTILDDIEQLAMLAEEHKSIFLSRADILALVAVARNANEYLLAHAEHQKVLEKDWASAGMVRAAFENVRAARERLNRALAPLLEQVKP